MKKNLFILAGFICFSFPLFSQNDGFITGTITDTVSGLPLPGATVFVSEHLGTTSEHNGTYFLSLPAGNYLIHVRFVGYQSANRKIYLQKGDTLIINFRLTPKREVLNEVVVSAEKFSQKLTDVNVSMSVLKPREMILQNTVSLDDILNKMSGIDIMDGQPSIRGGSGFSYGAGSRVLVVLDGLPLIAGDAGDVKWDYLPLESLSQVEIIKGASSVLYGSSALNGVINLRTKEPGLKPSSEAQVFTGLYLAPQRRELVWWNTPRWMGGASFSHARKIGNLDLVGGFNVIQDNGYREQEYKKNIRANLNLRYMSKKIKGLSYGLNLNGMHVNKSDFFLWQNADSGAYRQNIAGTSPYTGYRMNADPYIRYMSSKGGLHVLKTRYFSVSNNMRDNPDKNNHFDLFMGEYRYQKNVAKLFRITAGVFENYGIVNSRLYGAHHRNETALYIQLHGLAGARLKYSLGSRWESYWLDKSSSTSMPVFRTGINYRVFSHTNFRFSAGQGYRYPSIAEKYTATSVGALNIFPNPDLLPEKGWSMEAGMIQGFAFGYWKGYVDLSLFRNEYRNMIEFTFGLYLPDSIQVPSLKYVGFKALNIGHTRITGTEIIAHLEKNTGQVHVQFLGGYTWLNPLDLTIPKNDTVNNILKYRYRHGLKGSVDMQWRGLSAGMTFVYRGPIERVDSVFIDPFIGNILLPGYPEYFREHRQGNWIIDVRAGYQVTAFMKLSIICKNLFNREYSGRPGDIRPPRNVSLQLYFKW